MIAIALAVLVLAVLSLLLLRLFAPGDEPPIRVRNGSMDIELVQGQWDDSGDGWSPSGGWNWGTFEVKVTSANGHACSDGQSGSGKEVWVRYSDRTEISFTSTGSMMGKTRVQPKSKLERVSPQLLRHGSEADGGFIVGVGAKGGAKPWSCEFEARSDLDIINICPRSNPACR
jgi:hypothetical protein